MDDDLLRRLREARAFDAAEVASAKVGRIQRWFAGQELDARRTSAVSRIALGSPSPSTRKAREAREA